MAKQIVYRGYEECYCLANEAVQVRIVAEAGGRVLSYERNGYDIIYQNSANDGKTLDNAGSAWEPDGGRLDIGPEESRVQNFKVPPRPQLWQGAWKTESLGPNTLQLTSAVVPELGVQVVRVYELDEHSSRLEVRQTMQNVSDAPTRWNFWSRTMVKGGGVCIQPVQAGELCPQGWAKYGKGHIETQKPHDDRVAVQDDLLVVAAGGQGTKFVTDAPAEWIAYVRDDWMFVKRFRYFPDETYTDGLGFTTSIYVDYPCCEIEPLSPQVNLQPGQSYTFSEWWWLLPYPHPKPLGFDARAVADFLEQQTLLP
jgi:hypothetical protein